MPKRARRHAWVLLETVIATGLLILVLTVIGVQLQDARLAVKKMERNARALMLAEMQLAQLDLGLIELESALRPIGISAAFQSQPKSHCGLRSMLPLIPG